MPVITNTTNHWWVPNVVVAHLSEGIEAVHLATGRTLCKVSSHTKTSSDEICGFPAAQAVDNIFSHVIF